jgi:Zn-dependent protease with chaperone function
VTRLPALIGRQSGELELYRDRVVFNIAGGISQPVVISLSRLRVELGGTNSTLFLLSDSLNPGDHITVQNESLIEKLAEYGHQPSAAILEVSRRKKSLRVALAASPIALTVVLCVLFPILIGSLPVAWLEGALSHSQERKLGQLILPTVSNADESFAVKPKAALGKIAAQLRDSNKELQQIDFDIRISPSEDINAFALPGGIIVMNRGLLLAAHSVEEVAGVLAHEMAHVQRRHTLRSLAGRLGYLGGFLILSVFLSPDAAVVIGKSFEVAQLKYSRDDEREADTVGHQFLLNAGIDPKGMISFFQKLSENESRLLGNAQSITAKAAKIFSTHPLSEERMESLTTLSKKFESSHVNSKSRTLDIHLDELKSGF